MTVLLLLAADVHADFPAFRVHQLNPEATFTSCAAIDVDHDGKLDVVSGGWWYQAPDWKKHFLREVEMIRGRYDDYSNLPLDVNGDGWTDIISANYRSETLYWIEHPGAKLGPWTAHVIEKPGPMETARLFDIDGDGWLDVLPNGTQFSAWWELVTEPTAGDKPAFRWARHELPSELAAHGVGFGDIDGDGRGDLVSPAGWMKAPEDPRRGRWLWQPEFRLHRDGSIPMLVFDVDDDGDNDIVYGRGHQTGLYWVEQVRGAASHPNPLSQGEGTKRRWVRHAIDTSWSQAHSLMLGDMDNDGRIELIAGKRFLGHDGRDLGEWDPMVIYSYTFERDPRTWTRNTITTNDAAGFDLDPKLADMDGDGDLDILGATR
ncbi:MAG: VCBS repeat-containing protein, partial [Planctomycetes bacterium]|nr:VCBS repeat-containing protein [Planctomycetota bacterium]